jgi:predicted DNA-binding transcriptional regulator AlpA
MRYHQGYSRREVHSLGIPDLITAKDLEAILKIDVKTIYSYVQRGLIPYVRIQSNVRFLKSQILIWIENQNYSPRKLASLGTKNEKK